jgi:protein gp37
MGEQTAISWTDHTFNPWWGCWKIADECKHCYADDLANRYAKGLWGRTAPRRFFSDKHWNEPRKWNRKAKRDGVRRRVFVGSMCDWAEVHPVPEIAAQMDAARERLFALIKECTSLDWLLLSKRTSSVAQHLPWMAPEVCGPHGAVQIAKPWSHVWIGTTAGTRERMRRDGSDVRLIPAAVRFISCEPLLEDIPRDEWDAVLDPGAGGGEIHWLIVGNESGHKRRPAEMDWVRTARDAAAAHDVRFHFKQWVELNGAKVHLPVLDERQWAEFPTQMQEGE